MPDSPDKQAPAYDRETIEAIENPIDRLRKIMDCLLGPGGCPWDREQTHATLRKYTLEEAYEVAEAIDDGDDAELCEELGDLALQVVFHAALARQREAFVLEDVYEAICRKLIDRHPHVFGTVQAEDAATVLQNWEQIKKDEKRRKAEAKGEAGIEHRSVLKGVPRALPALQRARRLQEKAARVGFDWKHPEDVIAKVREEVEEVIEAAQAQEGGAAGEPSPALYEEWGDLMFSLVNLSRFIGIDSEEALQAANGKFRQRFMALETLAEAQGKELDSLSLDALDQLWDQVKAQPHI